MSPLPATPEGTASQRWPVQALHEAIAPWLAGFSVEVLAEVDSTNSELMRRARQGHTSPTLLVAERQNAGRGRMGRTWHSHIGTQGQEQPQASLTFSLGLVVQRADLSGMSLAVGLALAQALHPDVKLKWPNDLWWRGRKLGGILIETATQGAQRYCVIGVGLNIAAPPHSDLRNPAAGLVDLEPRTNAAQALVQVFAPLVQALLRFETQGFAPLQQAYADRDVLRGCNLICSDGRTGVSAGVDERGALLLHTAHGMEAVVSDEVSVRPTPSATQAHPTAK